jgi:hypothetical protein
MGCLEEVVSLIGPKGHESIAQGLPKVHPGCGVWTFERAKTFGRSASRRVRYDRAQLIPEVIARGNVRHVESVRTPAPVIPYARDGSLGGRFSRHFVPRRRSHRPSGPLLFAE